MLGQKPKDPTTNPQNPLRKNQLVPEGQNAVGLWEGMWSQIPRGVWAICPIIHIRNTTENLGHTGWRPRGHILFNAVLRTPQFVYVVCLVQTQIPMGKCANACPHTHACIIYTKQMDIRQIKKGRRSCEVEILKILFYHKDKMHKENQINMNIKIKRNSF